MNFTVVGGQHRNISAHRLAWLLVHPDEELPSGEDVRHTCDVRACVEPAHLVRGPRQLNVDDMWERGRRNTKLEQHRVAICARYAQGAAIRALARDYNVSQRGMQFALRRWGVYRAP